MYTPYPVTVQGNCKCCQLHPDPEIPDIILYWESLVPLLLLLCTLGNLTANSIGVSSGDW